MTTMLFYCLCSTIVCKVPWVKRTSDSSPFSLPHLLIKLHLGTKSLTLSPYNDCLKIFGVYKIRVLVNVWTIVFDSLSFANLCQDLITSREYLFPFDAYTWSPGCLLSPREAGKYSRQLLLCPLGPKNEPWEQSSQCPVEPTKHQQGGFSQHKICENAQLF